MKKIFISHSSFDKEVAEALVEFLESGLGIHSNSIFCSSVSGHDIPIGVNFNDYIINQLKDAPGFLVIAIISNDYYNSKYCLYELGAAWGLCKGDDIWPFLIKGMKYGNLQDFISHRQSVDGANKEHIDRLADQIRDDNHFERNKIPTPKFEKEREKLISSIVKLNHEYLSAGNHTQHKHTNSKITPYKLVAFDFDGVILQGKNYKHSWKEIWNHLHYDDSIRKNLFEKHRNDHKNYTFQDWCNECVTYFKDRKFKKQHIDEIIEKRQLKVAEGFNELIVILSKLGIKVIIISGGIDTFIFNVLEENTMQLIDKIFVNKFIYDKEGYLESVDAYQNNNSDSAGKTKALEKYCIENKIRNEEVVFIGDETNDIDVMQSVGKAIVYPGDSASQFNKDIKDFTILFNKNMVHVLPELL